MERTMTVPYEDYQKLTKDAADKESVVKLLNTKFPDDTCQIVAIKSLLGIEDVTDPEPEEPTTDDTDPSETTD